MKNKELYERYKALVIKALERLDEAIAHGEPVPIDIVEDVKITKEGNSRKGQTVLREEPLYWRLVYQHEGEIKILPEFISCENFLFENKLVIKSDHDEKVVKEIIGRDYLISVLIHFLHKSKSTNFDSDIFNKLYNEVESYFYSDELRFLALAPLQNFEIEEVFESENNVKIRKITQEELNELFRMAKGGFSVSISQPEVMRLDAVLEMQYLIRKGSPLSTREPKEIFDKLISALRLFKPGFFGINLIRCSALSWQPRMVSSSELSYRIFWGQGYKLTKSDLEEFKSFWGIFNQFNFGNHKFLEIALKRFNYAYERMNTEDKIIDYMISMESMFFKEDEKRELEFKLAIRSAMLLGKTAQEKREIFNTIKEAYDIRSKIVHGSSKHFKKDLGTITTKIENYVRNSISSFMRILNTKNYEDIITDLDSSMFV